LDKAFPTARRSPVRCRSHAASHPVRASALGAPGAFGERDDGSRERKSTYIELRRNLGALHSRRARPPPSRPPPATARLPVGGQSTTLGRRLPRPIRAAPPVPVPEGKQDTPRPWVADLVFASCASENHDAPVDCDGSPRIRALRDWHMRAPDARRNGKAGRVPVGSDSIVAGRVSEARGGSGRAMSFEIS
jgi:hypothetical protein